MATLRGLARYLSETEGVPEPDFEIVHYGIAAGPEPEPYAGDELRFLCVGRLIPIKGHVVLLRAFRKVLDARPDARLDIAGRGPLEHGLKDLARELGLAGAVRFLGHVTPIQRAVERSFAVVVPSLGEGFGMVALEAMERARPVIAAAIGGLGEIVRDGVTGVLVPPGEAEPLTDAIVRVASDPELARRMGEAGRQRALARFLQSFCTERTELLYEDALRQRAHVGRDDGKSADHRLEDGEAESLPARRLDVDGRAAQPGGDVRDAAGEIHARPFEARALGPFAEHDEHDVLRQVRERLHADVDALLPRQPRRGQDDARPGGHGVGRVLPPRRGRLVEAVVDGLDLARRHADPLDGE